MKYTRKIALIAVFFIASSALFMSGALAANGPYMDGTDVSAVSAETNMQKYEFLIMKVATPELMEVAVGDTVTWRNFQRPKHPVVLVSDDGLWDDQTIYYGKIFTHTFEETGTYTFSAKDNPTISGTIIVSEKKMASVVDTPAKEDMMLPMPVPIMGDGTGERVQSMERIQDLVIRSNMFIITRTLTPKSMEVHAGDTVTWRNLKRPKIPVVLVSDEALWDDQIISYGRIFSYTFEETGIYAFSAKDDPAISGTIIVSEKRLASVVDTPAREDMVVPMPVPIMGDEDAERVRSTEQTQEQMWEQVMTRSNEFLIIRSITPEVIEIDVGETVTWRNLQRPKFAFVLVSDDGLWDNQTIYYGKIFSHTFDEPGIYTFSAVNKPSIKVTVVVK